MSATLPTETPSAATVPAPRAPRPWKPILSHWQALLLLAPLLLLLALFVLYPLVKLAIDSLTLGEGVGNYADAFESRAARKALLTTLIASVVITALSVAGGSLIAWYIRTARSSLVKAVLWLAVLAPFWMGTIVKTYAIILIIGNDGLLDDTLNALGFDPVSLLYTPTAVVIGMVYTMLPYAAVSVYAVFVSIDDSLLAAASSMGASRAYAIRTVVVPLALPGIVASVALVFALSIGFYVTPILLGGAQTSFMASVIQDNVLSYFNYPLASALSVVLLVVAVATLAIAFALVGADRLKRALA